MKNQTQQQSYSIPQPLSSQILFNEAYQALNNFTNAIGNLQGQFIRNEIFLQTLMVIGCGIIGFVDIVKTSEHDLQLSSVMQKPLFICLICVVCFIESLIIAVIAWRFHPKGTQTQNLNNYQMKKILLPLGVYITTSQLVLFEISMINRNSLVNPVVICAMILQIQTLQKVLAITMKNKISGCLMGISMVYIISRLLASDWIGIIEYFISFAVIIAISTSQVIIEKFRINYESFCIIKTKNLLNILTTLKHIYSTLLQHIPQGIAIIDTSLDIHCTNTALNSILHSENTTQIFSALNQLSWSSSAVNQTNLNINNSSINISQNNYVTKDTNNINNNSPPSFNSIIETIFKKNAKKNHQSLRNRQNPLKNTQQNCSENSKKNKNIPFMKERVSLMKEKGETPLTNKDQQQQMQGQQQQQSQIITTDLQQSSCLKQQQFKQQQQNLQQVIQIDEQANNEEEGTSYEIEANSAEGKQLHIKLVHYDLSGSDRGFEREDGLEEEEQQECGSSKRNYFFGQSLMFLIIEDQSQAQMVKRLENQNEYKMRMLASVSHELRTPLNCSIAMLQIMRESLQFQGEVNMVKDNLDPALYSSKLLLNLINDILDFAQLEAGKFKMTSQLFSLKQILQECLVLISIQSRIKNLQLRLQMANSEQEDYNSSSQIELALHNNHNQLGVNNHNDRCLINSDPNRVRQVVLNLLSNALKFTNHGFITLRTEIIQTKPLSVKIICEDTGIGIPPDRCTSIFDNFNKADLQNRIKYNQCGAGLGLSISNQLAKMLCPSGFRDQPITVVSEVGKGSSFSFVIQDQTQISNEMGQKKSNTITNSNENKHNNLKRNEQMLNQLQQQDQVIETEEPTLTIKIDPTISLTNPGLLNNPKVTKMSQFGKQSALSPVGNSNDNKDSSSSPMINNDNSFSGNCKDNSIIHGSINNLDNSDAEFISKTVRQQSQPLLEEQAANAAPVDVIVKYHEGEALSQSIQEQDRLPIMSYPPRRTLSPSYSSAFIGDSQTSIPSLQPMHFDVVKLEMQDKKQHDDIEQQQQLQMHKKEDGFTSPSKKIDMEIEIRRSSDNGGAELDDTSIVNNLNFPGEPIKPRCFSNARISSSAKLSSNGQGGNQSLYKELMSKQNSIDSHQNYMYSYSLSSQKHTQYSTPSQFNPIQTPQQLVIQQQQQYLMQQVQQQITQPNSPYGGNITTDAANSNKYKKLIQQSKTVQVIPQKHKWLCHSLEEFKASQLKRTCGHSQVLVVDDNQFNIIALQQQIMKFHLQIDMAFSGESALHMIQQRVLANYPCCPTYLVVFMDIDMPIMNGYEATILINQFFREQNISSFDCPIIACSAYVSPEDKQAAFDSGMLDYIVKPIMLGTLDKVFFHWFVSAHNATVSEFA